MTSSSPSTSTRPGSCSTRPATSSGRTASGRCRTGPRSGACGCSPAARRSRRSTPWTSSRSGSASSASTPRSPRWTAARWATRSWRAATTPSSGTGTSSPTPTAILADFTCDQRGGLSDSWYCDAGYDAMYAAAEGGDRPGRRAWRSSRRCSSSSTTTSPYIVTAYTGIGEAVRNDRFACFQPQPDPGGVWLVQYGGRNYTLLRPAKDAGDCDGVTTAIGASKKPGQEQREQQHADLPRGRRHPRRARPRRRHRAAAAGGRRRPTGSDRAAAMSNVIASSAPRPSRWRGRAAMARYVATKVAGAGGSLMFVLVVNFFLFRVLPGDPARTLGRGRLKSAEDLAAFRNGVRPRPAAPPAVRHLPAATRSPATSATRCATGCR